MMSNIVELIKEQMFNLVTDIAPQFVALAVAVASFGVLKGMLDNNFSVSKNKALLKEELEKSIAQEKDISDDIVFLDKSIKKMSKKRHKSYDDLIALDSSKKLRDKIKLELSYLKLENENKRDKIKNFSQTNSRYNEIEKKYNYRNKNNLNNRISIRDNLNENRISKYEQMRNDKIEKSISNQPSIDEINDAFSMSYDDSYYQ